MHANTPIPAPPETQVTSSVRAHGIHRSNLTRHSEAYKAVVAGVAAADGCGNRARVLRGVRAFNERRLKHPTDTNVIVKFSVAIVSRGIVRDENVRTFGGGC